MKIALVHDYLNQMGGAENVLEEFAAVFPNAPIYTSVVNTSKLREGFRNFDIRPSFIQKLPFVTNHFKKYLPLYPLAFDRMQLSGFDVILSMSSAFAKGVSYSPRTLHINYCLTPMRFAWMFKQYDQKERIPLLYKPFLYLLLKHFRKWDLEKNRNIHRFITLSKAVQSRIQDWYGRDSDIIYPPIDTKKFTIGKENKDYFLVVSRLRGYKRIDLAVKACTELNFPLKVIGTGECKAQLQKIAGPMVEFLGYKSDSEVVKYVQECKAFIFPGEEDFGIAPLEAQSAGRPVIAFKAGGALDTIIEGETGLFFEHPTVESLVNTIKQFENHEIFNSHTCRKNALQFSTEHFRKEIKNYVEYAWDSFSKEQKNRHL